MKKEATDMFKVLDVFKIGDMLSVTLDGKCEMLKMVQNCTIRVAGHMKSFQ